MHCVLPNQCCEIATVKRYVSQERYVETKSVVHTKNIKREQHHNNQTGIAFAQSFCIFIWTKHFMNDFKCGLLWIHTVPYVIICVIATLTLSIQIYLRERIGIPFYFHLVFCDGFCSNCTELHCQLSSKSLKGIISSIRMLSWTMVQAEVFPCSQCFIAQHLTYSGF